MLKSNSYFSFITTTFFNSFMKEGPYHIKTSPLICYANNQVTTKKIKITAK